MGRAVGIDLGTTNTVVAAVDHGIAGTLADSEGARLIPSIVSFHPSSAVVVGGKALDRRIVDPRNTIWSIKRLIGRPWSSPEVQQARATFAFELREGANGSVLVAARGQTYALPEISAFVLRQAKAVGEAALGEPVERAVVTVPANFNDLQRAATKTSARLAGIEVLRILNEPTAAALAYGPAGKARERIAVYDLGGGTFDVTILDLAGNVFEVLSTAGDSALGGDDIDLLVAERMAADLLKKHRYDPHADPMAFARLRMLAERTKLGLSSAEEHTQIVDDLVPGDRGTQIEWRFRMTRPELEWASLALVERTFRVCQQALDAAGTTPAELDRIILVGGATRMPMVARKVEQFFGRPPIARINPDEVVALGAAIQAALLDRSRRSSLAPARPMRVSEHSIASRAPEPDPEPLPDDVGLLLPVVGGRHGAAPPAAVVAAPSPVPVRPTPTDVPDVPAPAPAAEARFLPGSGGRELVFEPSPVVPDLELPAQPAAPAKPPPAPRHDSPSPFARGLPGPPPPPARPRQATVRYEYEPARAPMPAHARPLLIDVTPLSLGVETVGGYCDVLIDANTPVPCDRTRTFGTASDGQTVVRVRVSQGSSGRFDDNTCLGELELTGIAPAIRGEQQIAVTFEIDADGILNVKARDATTGRETTARMQLVGAQSEPADLAAMQARQAANPIASLTEG